MHADDAGLGHELLVPGAEGLAVFARVKGKRVEGLVRLEARGRDGRAYSYGSWCMEEVGFQTCLALRDAGFQVFLPRCGLTSILSTLFLSASIILTALVRGLLLLHLKKLQECRDLCRWRWAPSRGVSRSGGAGAWGGPQIAC